MPTIWGNLDRVEEDIRGIRWVQVRTTLSGGGTSIRVRVLVGRQTIVARGIERIDFSTLCAGEFVEVTYHHSHAEFMEAETIYVRPERVPVA